MIGLIVISILSFGLFLVFFVLYLREKTNHNHLKYDYDDIEDQLEFYKHKVSVKTTSGNISGPRRSASLPSMPNIGVNCPFKIGDIIINKTTFKTLKDKNINDFSEYCVAVLDIIEDDIIGVRRHDGNKFTLRNLEGYTVFVQPKPLWVDETYKFEELAKLLDKKLKII